MMNAVNAISPTDTMNATDTMNQITPEVPSRMRLWYDTATVRSHPRRTILFDTGKDFPFQYYAPELVPMHENPRFQGLAPGVRNQVFAMTLLEYLSFTENLEHYVVNAVAFRIARDDYGFHFGQELELDAYRIYVDEAYHALFSADLRRQVECNAGVRFQNEMSPRFLQLLAALEERSPASCQPLVRLFFTTVSETLISLNLRKLAKDPVVFPAVRSAVADHAKDEAIHHAFFAGFLDQAWPRLTESQKDFIGGLFGEYLLAFLLPDKECKRRQLEACGISKSLARNIVHESYPAELALYTARAGANPTLKILEKCGILQHSAVRDGLHEAGILE
jgi:hypothetical protein